MSINNKRLINQPAIKTREMRLDSCDVIAREEERRKRESTIECQIAQIESHFTLLLYICNKLNPRYDTEATVYTQFYAIPREF